MNAKSSPGGWRGRTPMRLTRTLRGEGMLLTRQNEVPVAYAIDIFDEGPRCVATGWIDGACAKFARLKAARLRLDDGAEIGISLEVQDAHSASVEISDPLSLKAA